MPDNQEDYIGFLIEAKLDIDKSQENIEKDFDAVLSHANSVLKSKGGVSILSEESVGQIQRLKTLVGGFKTDMASKHGENLKGLAAGIKAVTQVANDLKPAIAAIDDSLQAVEQLGTRLDESTRKLGALARSSGAIIRNVKTLNEALDLTKFEGQLSKLNPSKFETIATAFNALGGSIKSVDVTKLGKITEKLEVLGKIPSTANAVTLLGNIGKNAEKIDLAARSIAGLSVSLNSVSKLGANSGTDPFVAHLQNVKTQLIELNALKSQLSNISNTVEIESPTRRSRSKKSKLEPLSFDTESPSMEAPSGRSASGSALGKEFDQTVNSFVYTMQRLNTSFSVFGDNMNKMMAQMGVQHTASIPQTPASVSQEVRQTEQTQRTSSAPVAVQTSPTVHTSAVPSPVSMPAATVATPAPAPAQPRGLIARAAAAMTARTNDVMGRAVEGESYTPPVLQAEGMQTFDESYQKKLDILKKRVEASGNQEAMKAYKRLHAIMENYNLQAERHNNGTYSAMATTGKIEHITNSVDAFNNHIKSPANAATYGGMTDDLKNAFNHVKTFISGQNEVVHRNAQKELQSPQASLRHIGAGAVVADLAVQQVRQLFGNGLASRLTVQAQPLSGGNNRGSSGAHSTTINAVALANQVQELIRSGKIRGEEDVLNPTAPVQDLIRQATSTSLHEAGHSIFRDLKNGGASGQQDYNTIMKLMREAYGIKFNAAAARDKKNWHKAYTSNEKNINQHTIEALMRSGAYTPGEGEDGSGHFEEEIGVDIVAKTASGTYGVKNKDNDYTRVMHALFKSNGKMTPAVRKILDAHQTNSKIVNKHPAAAASHDMPSMEADIISNVTQFLGPDDIMDMVHNFDKATITVLSNYAKIHMQELLKNARTGLRSIFGPGRLSNKIASLVKSVVPQQPQMAFAGGSDDWMDAELDDSMPSAEGGEVNAAGRSNDKKREGRDSDSSNDSTEIQEYNPDGDTILQAPRKGAMRAAMAAQNSASGTKKQERKIAAEKELKARDGREDSSAKKAGDEKVELDKSGNWRQIASASHGEKQYTVLAPVDENGHIIAGKPMHVHDNKGSDAAFQSRGGLNKFLGTDAQTTLTPTLDAHAQAAGAARHGYESGGATMHQGDFLAATNHLKLSPNVLNKAELVQVRDHIKSLAGEGKDKVSELSDYFVLGNDIYRQVGEQAYKMSGGWSKISQILSKSHDAVKTSDIVAKAKENFDKITDKKSTGGVFENANTEAERLFKSMAESGEGGEVKPSKDFEKNKATHPSPEYAALGKDISFVKHDGQDFIADSGRRRSFRYNSDSEALKILMGMLQPHERKDEGSALERIKGLGGEAARIATARQGELAARSKGKNEAELQKNISKAQEDAMAEAKGTKLSMEKAAKSSRDAVIKDTRKESGSQKASLDKHTDKAIEEAKHKYELALKNAESETNAQARQVAKVNARIQRDLTIKEIMATQAERYAAIEAEGQTKVAAAENAFQKALLNAAHIIGAFESMVLPTIDAEMRSKRGEKSRTKAIDAQKKSATTQAGFNADEEANDIGIDASTTAKNKDIQDNLEAKKTEIASQHARDIARAKELERQVQSRVKAQSKYDKLTGGTKPAERFTVHKDADGKTHLLDSEKGTAHEFDTAQNAMALVKNAMGGRLEEETVIARMSKMGSSDVQALAIARQNEIKKAKDEAEDRKTKAQDRSDAAKKAKDARDQAKKDKEDALKAAEGRDSLVPGLSELGNGNAGDLRAVSSRAGFGGMEALVRDKNGNVTGTSQVRTTDQLFKHLGSEMNFMDESKATDAIAGVKGNLSRLGMGSEVGSATVKGANGGPDKVISTIRDQYGNLHTIIQQGNKVFIESYGKNMVALANTLKRMGADLTSAGITNDVQEDIKSKSDKLNEQMKGQTVLFERQRGKDTLKFFKDGSKLKAGVYRDGELHSVEEANSKSIVGKGEDVAHASGKAEAWKELNNQLGGEGFRTQGARTIHGRDMSGGLNTGTSVGTAEVHTRAGGDGRTKYVVVSEANGRMARHEFDDQNKAIQHLDKMGVALTTEEQKAIAQKVARDNAEKKARADRSKATVTLQDKDSGDIIHILQEAGNKWRQIIFSATDAFRKDVELDAEKAKAMLRSQKPIVHGGISGVLDSMVGEKSANYQNSFTNGAANAELREGTGKNGQQQYTVAIEEAGEVIIYTFNKIADAAKALQHQGFDLDEELENLASGIKEVDFTNFDNLLNNAKKITNTDRRLEIDKDGEAHYHDRGLVKAEDGTWHKVEAKVKAEKDANGNFIDNKSSEAFNGNVIEGQSKQIKGFNEVLKEGQSIHKSFGGSFLEFSEGIVKGAYEMAKYMLLWNVLFGAIGKVKDALMEAGKAALDFGHERFQLTERLGGLKNTQEDAKNGVSTPKSVYTEENKREAEGRMSEAMAIAHQSGVKDTTQVVPALAALGNSFEKRFGAKAFDEGSKALAPLSQYAATNEIGMNDAASFGQTMISKYNLSAKGLNEVLDNTSMLSGRHGINEELLRQGMMETSSDAASGGFGKNAMALYTASAIKGFSHDEAQKNIGQLASMPKNLNNWDNRAKLVEESGGDKILTQMIRSKASAGDFGARVIDRSEEMLDAFKKSGSKDRNAKSRITQMGASMGFGSFKDYQLYLENFKSISSDQGFKGALDMQRSGTKLNTLGFSVQERWQAKMDNDPQMILNKISAGFQRIFHVIGGGAADAFKKALDHISDGIEKIAANEKLLKGIGAIIGGIFEKIASGIEKLMRLTGKGEKGQELKKTLERLGTGQITFDQALDGYEDKDMKKVPGKDKPVPAAADTGATPDASTTPAATPDTSATPAASVTPAASAAVVPMPAPTPGASTTATPKPVPMPPTPIDGSKHHKGLWTVGKEVALDQVHNPIAQGGFLIALTMLVNRILAANALQKAVSGTPQDFGTLSKIGKIMVPRLPFGFGNSASDLWRESRLAKRYVERQEAKHNKTQTEESTSEETTNETPAAKKSMWQKVKDWRESKAAAKNSAAPKESMWQRIKDRISGEDDEQWTPEEGAEYMKNQNTIMEKEDAVTRLKGAVKHQSGRVSDAQSLHDALASGEEVQIPDHVHAEAQARALKMTGLSMDEAHEMNAKRGAATLMQEGIDNTTKDMPELERAKANSGTRARIAQITEETKPLDTLQSNFNKALLDITAERIAGATDSLKELEKALSEAKIELDVVKVAFGDFENEMPSMEAATNNSAKATSKLTEAFENTVEAAKSTSSKLSETWGRMFDANSSLRTSIGETIDSITKLTGDSLKSLRNSISNLGDTITDLIARLTGKGSSAPAEEPVVPGRARGTQPLTSEEEAAVKPGRGPSTLNPEDAANAKGTQASANKGTSPLSPEGTGPLAPEGAAPVGGKPTTGGWFRNAAGRLVRGAASVAKGAARGAVANAGEIANGGMLLLGAFGAGITAHDYAEGITGQEIKNNNAETSETYSRLRLQQAGVISKRISELQAKMKGAPRKDLGAYSETIQKLQKLRTDFYTDKRHDIATVETREHGINFNAKDMVTKGLALGLGTGGGILGGGIGLATLPAAPLAVPALSTAFGLGGGALGNKLGSYLPDTGDSLAGYRTRETVVRKQTAGEAFDEMTKSLNAIKVNTQTSAVVQKTDTVKRDNDQRRTAATGALPSFEEPRQAPRERIVERTQTVVQQVQQNRSVATHGVSTGAPVSSGGQGSAMSNWENSSSDDRGSLSIDQIKAKGKMLGIKNLDTLAPLIQKEATAKGIPAEVVLSIMAQESGGNIGAIGLPVRNKNGSISHAYGSMQVMDYSTKFTPAQLRTAPIGVKAGVEHIMNDANTIRQALTKNGKQVDDKTFWRLVASSYLTGSGYKEYGQGRIPGAKDQADSKVTANSYANAVDANLAKIGFHGAASGGSPTGAQGGSGFFDGGVKPTYGDGIGAFRRQHPKTPHQGVDVQQPAGTKLYAQSSGTFKGYSFSKLGGKRATYVDDKGNTVSVDHIDPVKGDAPKHVERGTLLGTIAQIHTANAGDSTGAHGHWEVRTKDGKLQDIRAYTNSTAVRKSEVDPLSGAGANGQAGTGGDDRPPTQETFQSRAEAALNQAMMPTAMASAKLQNKQMTPAEFEKFRAAHEPEVKAGLVEAKANLKEMEADSLKDKNNKDKQNAVVALRKSIEDYQNGIFTAMKESSDRLRDQLLSAMDLRLGILDSYISKVSKMREHLAVDARQEFSVVQSAQKEQMEILDGEEAFITNELTKAELAKDYTKQIELQGKLKDISLRKEEMQVQILQAQVKLVNDYFGSLRSATELKTAYNKVSFIGTDLEKSNVTTAGEGQFQSGNQAGNFVLRGSQKGSNFVEAFSKLEIGKHLGDYLQKAVEKADAMVRKFKEWVGVLNTGIDMLGVISKSDAAKENNAALGAMNNYAGGIADYHRTMAANPNMSPEMQLAERNKLTKLQLTSRDQVIASAETGIAQVQHSRDLTFADPYGGEGSEIGMQLRANDYKRSKLMRQQAVNFQDLGMNGLASDFASQQAKGEMTPELIAKTSAGIMQKVGEIKPEALGSAYGAMGAKASEVGDASGHVVADARKPVNEIMYTLRAIREKGQTPDRVEYLRKQANALMQGGQPLLVPSQATEILGKNPAKGGAAVPDKYAEGIPFNPTMSPKDVQEAITNPNTPIMKATAGTPAAQDKAAANGNIANAEKGTLEQVQNQNLVTDKLGDVLSTQIEILEAQKERLEILAKLEKGYLSSLKGVYENQDYRGQKYSEVSRKYGNVVGETIGYEQSRQAKMKGNISDIGEEHRVQRNVNNRIAKLKAEGRGEDDEQVMAARKDSIDSQNREEKAKIDLEYNMKDLNPLQEKMMEIAKDFGHGLSDAFKSAAAEYFKYIPNLEKQRAEVNHSHMQERAMDMFMPASPGMLKMRQFRDLNQDMAEEEHSYKMTTDPGYRFNFEMNKKMKELPGELASKGANMAADLGQGVVQTAMTDPSKLGDLLNSAASGDGAGIWEQGKKILGEGNKDPKELEKEAATGLDKAVTKMDKEMDKYNKLATINLDLQKAYAMESSLALIKAAEAIEEAAFKSNPENKNKDFDKTKSVWATYGDPMQKDHDATLKDAKDATDQSQKDSGTSDSGGPKLPGMDMLKDLGGRAKDMVGEAGKLKDGLKGLGIDTSSLDPLIDGATKAVTDPTKVGEIAKGFMQQPGGTPGIAPVGGAPTTGGLPGPTAGSPAVAAAGNGAGNLGAAFGKASALGGVAYAGGMAGNWFGDTFMTGGQGDREKAARSKNGGNGAMAAGGAMAAIGAGLSLTGAGAVIGVPMMIAGGLIGAGGAGIGRTLDTPEVKQAKLDDYKDKEAKNKQEGLMGEEIEIQRRLLDAQVAQTRALQYQGQNFASLGDLIRQDVKLLSSSADLSGRGGDQRITGMAFTPGTGTSVAGSTGNNGTGGGMPSMSAAVGGLGTVAQYSTGGLVPGTGHGDTVPAMLTPGEFVLPKKTVEEIKNYNIGTTSSAEMFKNISAQQNAIQSGLNLAGFEQTINLKYNTPDAPSLDPIHQDVNMRYGKGNNVNAGFFSKNGGDLMREARSRGVN